SSSFAIRFAGRSSAARAKTQLRIRGVHLQRADDLGRIRCRYLQRREIVRAENRDGDERLHQAGSVSRYLRSRGRRERGLESVHGKLLRENYADAFAAGTGNFAVGEK